MENENENKNKMRTLKLFMRDVARAYSHLDTDETVQEIYTRGTDGIFIPPSTIVRVTVELLHKPDPEVTPVLEMAAEAVK